MISTIGLTKYYEDMPAVKGIDLFIGQGEICGLIGPNGAGKTTLLKMLAGLLQPTRGRIEIDGNDVGAEPQKLHEVVGYMPDTFGLYDEMLVWHFLDYFAHAHRVPKAEVPSRIDEVLYLTNLTSKREARVGLLSRGMRQRLVIAKTLLAKPKVLLLDEPASGLDPLARIELRDLIKQLGGMGHTLIVSSHILSELADFCTSVAIMERGRLIRSGRIEKIVEKLAQGLSLRIEMLDHFHRIEAVEAVLSELPTIQGLTRTGHTLDCVFLGNRDQLAVFHRELVLQYEGIVSFYERPFTVEDVFMAVSNHQVS
ncbi:MAG: ABC transporter ATP-binding protein [Blastocatellia bacterium]|nr:ABC transporter ATP-binding protein [Blastocatellia bacterium]